MCELCKKLLQSRNLFLLPCCLSLFNRLLHSNLRLVYNFSRLIRNFSDTLELLAPNICVAPIAQLRDIRDFVLVNVGGTAISIYTRVERLIIVVLDSISLGASQNWALIL